MIQYKKDKDLIVTLTFDMADRPVNIINHQVGKALLPVIDYLKSEKEKRKLKGIIVTSAKKNFLVGGDLDYLYQTDDTGLLFQLSQKMQALYRELEAPGVPVVAAINGTALGSGFELALACHHRVAIDHPAIRLGHPEVTLGIMPGAGGVVRLLWLLGIEKAFEILSKGRRYAPQEALQKGIIDALASNNTDLLKMAKEWLLTHSEQSRPWDRKNGQIPGGTPKNLAVAGRVQQLTAALIKSSPGFSGMEGHGASAPRAILHTLSEAAKTDFETGCRIESRTFARLVCSSAAKNTISAFWYDFNAIKKGDSRPKGYGKFRPKKIGIIGAGKIGVGIAIACLIRGMEVMIKDVSKAIADRGKERIVEHLTHLHENGKGTPTSLQQQIDNITTTSNAADFAHCDLVIEAVLKMPT